MATTSKSYTLVDMHSHMLPVGGVDDGCQNFIETTLLLHQAAGQGVDALVFTPHYYHTESIEDFIRRRDEAQQKLELLLPKIRERIRVPELYYGAEVLYQPRMAHWEQLDLLCIKGTRYLLLEMPFNGWDESIFDDIAFMIHSRGIRIIIAHLERYLKLAKRKMLNRLTALQGPNLLIQMNGSYILENPRDARKRIDKGLVDLIGSDAHDPTDRPETLGEASEMLQSWGMDETLREIGERSSRILNFKPSDFEEIQDDSL